MENLKFTFHIDAMQAGVFILEMSGRNCRSKNENRRATPFICPGFLTTRGDECL